MNWVMFIFIHLFLDNMNNIIMIYLNLYKKNWNCQHFMRELDNDYKKQSKRRCE